MVFSLRVLFLLILLPGFLRAQDFQQTVLPITSVKPGVHLQGPRLPSIGIAVEFGTGFCLDRACRFVGTNYHVAKLVKPSKIQGERIVQGYFATGPHDHKATPNRVSTSLMAYATSRDLAIFELRRPLSRHHGAAYSLKDLEPGQEVDIYTYPLEGVNPIRKIVRFQGSFKGATTQGLLAFDYAPSGTKTIRGGSSGGLVVDRKTQEIVGVLSDVAENGQPIAVAVSVQTLAEFVQRVQPYLAHDIFPSVQEIQPITADLYAKFVPSPGSALQRRPAESPEVKALREKADLLADSMNNFVAVQSFAWGKGAERPSAEAAYEIQVIDGIQKFRRYSDERGQFTDVAHPVSKGWVMPADEWSALPKLIGTDFRLKIHEAADAVVNERKLKVFQYYASVEDNLCPFEAVEDYIFFSVGKPVPVACYGEVWTDQDWNIIRMSENLDLSDKLKEYRGWSAYRVVLTYGWLDRPEEPSRLVPRTIFTEGQDVKNSYWCRGQFIDYRIFSTKSRLVAGTAQ